MTEPYSEELHDSIPEPYDDSQKPPGCFQAIKKIKYVKFVNYSKYPIYLISDHLEDRKSYSQQNTLNIGFELIGSKFNVSQQSSLTQSAAESTREYKEILPPRKGSKPSSTIIHPSVNGMPVRVSVCYITSRGQKVYLFGNDKSFVCGSKITIKTRRVNEMRQIARKNQFQQRETWNSLSSVEGVEDHDENDLEGSDWRSVASMSPTEHADFDEANMDDCNTISDITEEDDEIDESDDYNVSEVDYDRC